MVPDYLGNCLESFCWNWR